MPAGKAKTISMRYAAIFAGLFVLWPVMAMMGGQGFATMVGLTGLVALLAARPQWPFAGYTYLVCAFIVWCVITEFWSPSVKSVISGSLSEGTFSIDLLGLSILLTFLMGGLTVAGVMRVPDDAAGRSARWVLLMIALHGLALAFMAVPDMNRMVFETIYGAGQSFYGSGYQNIGRAASAFALIVPLLIGYVCIRPGVFWKIIGVLIYLVSLGVFWLHGFSAPIVGLVLGLLMLGVVMIFRRSGFRWILSALGAYISATPVLYGLGISLLRDRVESLPLSFHARVRAWEVVIEKTMENPIQGNGIGASRLWSDTFALRPEWLEHLPPEFAHVKIVQSHPHNMALHIWAETGVIGSVIAGLALVALAFRLPAPQEMRADIKYATVGLIGSATSIFSFSYSAWNEGFWASVFLATAAIILVAKRERLSV